MGLCLDTAGAVETMMILDGAFEGFIEVMSTDDCLYSMSLFYLYQDFKRRRKHLSVVEQWFGRDSL